MDLSMIISKLSSWRESSRSSSSTISLKYTSESIECRICRIITRISRSSRTCSSFLWSIVHIPSIISIETRKCYRLPGWYSVLRDIRICIHISPISWNTVLERCSFLCSSCISDWLSCIYIYESTLSKICPRTLCGWWSCIHKYYSVSVPKISNISRTLRKGIQHSSRSHHMPTTCTTNTIIVFCKYSTIVNK